MTDALDSLVLTAERNVFGRSVTYYGSETAPATLSAVYYPTPSNLSPATPAYEVPEPRLSFVKADLDEAGIVPKAGDLVAFTVNSEARTMRVTKAEGNDAGAMLVYLGARP